MTRQHLIIDADDTLWENNIFFEQAFDEFVAFLDHSRLSPPQVVSHDTRAQLFGRSTEQTVKKSRPTKFLHPY